MLLPEAVPILLLGLVTALSSEALHRFVDSDHFGSFDFPELEAAQYEVEIQNAPLSELELEGNTKPSESITMLSRHGQRYSCQLPLPVVVEEGEEEDQLWFQSLPNVSALLQPMSDKECLIKTVGWWTYEYCHRRFIRQYHMEAGKVIGESTMLGFYQNETEWDQSYIDRIKGIVDSVKHNIVDAVPQAYHTVYYVNGTECEVSGKPRTAQVEIFCSLKGVDKLFEVKEDATCNYTLSVHTSLLCSHPMLVPGVSSDKPQPLRCSPVVSQQEYEDYLLKQESIRQQKEMVDGGTPTEAGKKEKSSKTGTGSNVELSSSEHQLLRKLVMKSITQLAQAATENLQNSGYLDDQYELDEVDIDIKLNVDKDDTSKTKKSAQGEDSVDETQPTGEGSRQSHKSSTSPSNGDKVSEKMKKMADSVNTNGKDDALESLMTTLLKNLATTAEYIEAQDQEEEEEKQATGEEQAMPVHARENFKIDSKKEDEEEEEGEEKKKRRGKGNIQIKASAVANAPLVSGPEIGSKRRTGVSAVHREGEVNAGGHSEESKSDRKESQEGKMGVNEGVGEGVSSDGGEDGDGRDGEWALDPNLVKEMEHQMEETLSKELDNKDIEVKIITVSESQLKEKGSDQEMLQTGEEGDMTDSMASAVSKLFNKLLNEDDSEHEEKHKVLKLQNSYDRVWEDRHKGRRKSSNS